MNPTNDSMHTDRIARHYEYLRALRAEGLATRMTAARGWLVRLSQWVPVETVASEYGFPDLQAR